jgi:hypothetical protein
MGQAQYSTQEQLAELRILVEDQEYDLDNLTMQNARAIMKIANFHGLYDAADFVESQLGKTKLSLDWPEPEPLNMGDTDPYANHDICPVCRECITCGLRPCRDGGEHQK